MAADHDLHLDEDGVPILTDVVSSGEQTTTAQPAEDGSPLVKSATEITRDLLDNETFRQKLDEIAAHLTVDVRMQVENTVRPAIDEAVRQALNVSGDDVYRTISQQLESALPDIIARALQGKDTENG